MDENIKQENNNISNISKNEDYEKKQRSIKPKSNKFLPYLGGLITGLAIAAFISSLVYLSGGVDILASKLVSGTPKDTKEATVLTPSVEGKIKLLENSIKQYYLQDTNNDELEIGLYKGIVESLDDPYSTYYTPDDVEKLKEMTTGVYYGIGAYIGFDSATEYCKITKIIKGTPAEESGLLAKDIIVEIDGKSTQGMATNDVVSLIKGKENTDVVLKIYREGENDYLDITVTRRAVEAPTVEYKMMDNNIAYIEIAQFENVTPDQFNESMTKAREEGMKGLILDLRDNPGGTLGSVVDIAREILPEGMIVYTEDKYGKRDEYKCDGKHQLDVPMVVLVNENSASAAEILSGAIKDYGIGRLLGTKTFGKGIVQKVFPINDGSAIKLTISHYYTPKGNDIHKIGIEPDEELEFDYKKYQEDGSDNQLSRAQEILAGEISK